MDGCVRMPVDTARTISEAFDTYDRWLGAALTIVADGQRGASFDG